MKLVYQSPVVLAQLDDAGWLEFTVGDYKDITYTEIQSVAHAIMGMGITTIRVLVVRTFRYSTSADTMMSDLKFIDGLVVEKLAYFAPAYAAKTAAELESRTALRHVPTAIFAERNEAIRWLMEPQLFNPQNSVGNNARAQAAMSSQKIFRAGREGGIHPVARAAFRGTFKLHPLDFKGLLDQRIKIHTADNDVPAEGIGQFV
ncbi:MAG: hypothetical protein ABIP97_03840 [Chthoniobacterales bacterium]